jgi:hypothetical protein
MFLQGRFLSMNFITLPLGLFLSGYTFPYWELSPRDDSSPEEDKRTHVWYTLLASSDVRPQTELELENIL